MSDVGRQELQHMSVVTFQGRFEWSLGILDKQANQGNAMERQKSVHLFLMNE